MSSIVPFMCAMMILNNGLNKSHHSSYEDYSHVSHNLFSEETNRCTNIASFYPNQWSDTVGALGARMNNFHISNSGPYSDIHDISWANKMANAVNEYGWTTSEVTDWLRQSCAGSSQYQGLNDPYSIEQIERIRTSCQTSNIQALRNQIDNLECTILRQNLCSNAIQDLQNCVEKVIGDPKDQEITLYCDNQPYITCRTSNEFSDVDLKDVYKKVLETKIEIHLNDPIPIWSTDSCPGVKTKDKKSFIQKIGDALYKVTDILNMLIDLFISDDF